MTSTDPSPDTSAAMPQAGTALPDREWVDPAADISAVAGLLHETAQHHDPYEKSHAPHDWWDWYAAYFLARQQGRTPDEASQDAGRYMDETFHVAVL
jgi:hypothetical protein